MVSRRMFKLVMDSTCQINRESKKEIVLEGEYYTMYSLPVGTEIPSEVHEDAAQYIHCAAGNIQVIINDDEEGDIGINLKAGQFFLIPRGARHVVMNISTRETAKAWSEYIQSS